MKRTRTQRRKQADAWQVAAEAGCDMALLERNLKMTPAERIAAHQQALALVRAFREAKVLKRG